MSCGATLDPEGLFDLDRAWLCTTGSMQSLQVAENYAELCKLRGKGKGLDKGTGKMVADRNDSRRLRSIDGMCKDAEKKMWKRAKQFGEDSPEERILKDPQYAYRVCNRHRWGVGWPGVARALAAAVALLEARTDAAEIPSSALVVQARGN